MTNDEMNIICSDIEDRIRHVTLGGDWEFELSMERERRGHHERKAFGALMPAPVTYVSLRVKRGNASSLLLSFNSEDYFEQTRHDVVDELERLLSGGELRIVTDRIVAPVNTVIGIDPK